MTFLDNPEILEESQTLEFKESLFELPDDLWETYSAFANTEGGEIVLGVKQNRENETFFARWRPGPKRPNCQVLE